MTDRRLIAGWLNDLAVPVTGRRAEADADLMGKIAVITEMAASQLPGQCFCYASLCAASQTFKWYPSYAELYEFLTKWWEANQPSQLMLPSGDPDMTLADRSWLKAWLSEKPRFTAEKMAIRLSVLNKYAPRTFGYIVRMDPEARALAVRRGWLEEDEPVAHQAGREE